MTNALDDPRVFRALYVKPKIECMYHVLNAGWDDPKVYDKELFSLYWTILPDNTKNSLGKKIQNTYTHQTILNNPLIARGMDAPIGMVEDRSILVKVGNMYIKREHNQFVTIMNQTQMASYWTAKILREAEDIEGQDAKDTYLQERANCDLLMVRDDNVVMNFLSELWNSKRFKEYLIASVLSHLDGFVPKKRKILAEKIQATVRRLYVGFNYNGTYTNRTLAGIMAAYSPELGPLNPLRMNIILSGLISMRVV